MIVKILDFNSAIIFFWNDLLCLNISLVNISLD